MFICVFKSNICKFSFILLFQIQELQFSFEQEKTVLLKESQNDKELLLSEKEKELESVCNRLKSEISGIDSRSREKQERDAKVCHLYLK